MIVNAALQPVKNDTVFWLTSDTEDLYQQNLRDSGKRKLLEEWGWIDVEIQYSFNSHGFRSIEFDDRPAIAVFGCSHTQGIGLHYHQVWHQQLSKKLNDKPIFNFGIGGASADTCYRLAENYLPNLNVDTVIFLAPSEYRLEFWDINDSFPWFLNARSVPENHKFFTPWFIDPRNASMYSLKNIQSVAYICQMLGIDFYCYPERVYTHSLPNQRTYARDLLHFGADHNRVFADLVYNDIDFKRVYHPHWLNRAQPPRS